MNVLVVRDPRESKAKCSLTPLRGRPEVSFVEHARERRITAGVRTLLHPEGDELTAADAGRDLLLVDCSWRRVGSLLANVEGELVPRRLPPLVTAYPRKSKTFPDPAQGLASIEALFAASVILGEPRLEWLEAYRWREEFLSANPRLAELARARSG